MLKRVNSPNFPPANLFRYTVYIDKRCYINLCISLVQCRPPINGILKCPNGANTAVFGDTCTFSCKPGFNLQGQSTGMCLANSS